ncbi:Amidase [Ancylostoma ceylanicum]|uniref:Amidase n=1 Tax=Ancylostoma ceylanicum TaxID=53326 RepID=A0A0D6M1B0_9BILA|nr:Amidase [Ancylostoma ceylanicum]
MGTAEDVVYAISRVYLAIVHLVFLAINFFKKKQHVPAPHDDIVMMSATEAMKRIKNREITPTQLVSAYIHRIEQVNPMINAAVVTIFDEARKIAAEYDQRIADSSDHELAELIRRQPLFGIPFSCKDSLEVEGQIVTSGSWLRKDHRCTETAVAVKRMQDAGAILIAITNVPELCSWIESNNTVGVGSDVGGSIRIPSFVNGIFGLMPTPGIVPLDGHVPAPLGYKTQMLRVGPMCRYVEDIPLLLEIMAGDKAPSLHLNSPIDIKKCRIFYMFGIRLPLIRTLTDVMRDTLVKAVSHFENKFDMEGICVDLPYVVNHPGFYSASLEGNIPMSEKVLSLKGDAGKMNGFSELQKVILGKSHHTLAMVMLVLFESAKTENKEANEKAIQIRDRLKRQIVELLGYNGVLFFPSWPCPAPFHNEPLFSLLDTSYTAIFNALALPVIQCPMGLDANGIPLGVVGAPGCDRLLIAVAKELSEAFGGWKPAWQ